MKYVEGTSLHEYILFKTLRQKIVILMLFVSLNIIIAQCLRIRLVNPIS